MARAVLSPRDAGQAAGVWLQQKGTPQVCFLPAQQQVTDAWLCHGEAAPVTPLTFSLELQCLECQAAGGPDLLPGGNTIFKVSVSHLHPCFGSQARGLHMPVLGEAKMGQIIHRLQTNQTCSKLLLCFEKSEQHKRQLPSSCAEKQPCQPG